MTASADGRGSASKHRSPPQDGLYQQGIQKSRTQGALPEGVRHALDDGFGLSEELFFCVCGSHSNFGAVTGLEYRLHSVGPTVLAGMVVHPLDRGKEVLKFYRNYTSAAPEEMGTWTALLTSPDGHPVVAILVCYCGAPEAGGNVVAPLKEFGPPAADMIEPMTYVKAQSLIDAAFPPGRYNYWRSNLLTSLSDVAIDALVDGFRSVGSPYSSILIEHLGGAMSRVRRHDTAFGTRDAPYDCVIMPMWTEATESDKHIAWADGVWQALQSVFAGGVYVNYLGNEGEARVRAAYGANYERLAALKTKYDPENLFRVNQNIKPSG